MLFARLKRNPPSNESVAEQEKLALPQVGGGEELELWKASADAPLEASQRNEQLDKPAPVRRDLCWLGRRSAP